MRLSDQATALHMRLVQLKSAVSEGRLDIKAFGVKADQDNNPAHVAALLRVCLALMGKSQFEDPIDHWMLVPRQKLVLAHSCGMPSFFVRVLFLPMDMSQSCFHKTDT